MSSMTLTYRVNCTGAKTPAQMVTALTAAQAQIDTSLITSVYGCAITLWHAATSGTTAAVLTITIDTTGSNVVGVLAAFVDLFTADLRAVLLQPVLAGTPVAA